MHLRRPFFALAVVLGDRSVLLVFAQVQTEPLPALTRDGIRWGKKLVANARRRIRFTAICGLHPRERPGLSKSEMRVPESAARTAAVMNRRQCVTDRCRGTE